MLAVQFLESCGENELDVLDLLLKFPKACSKIVRIRRAQLLKSRQSRSNFKISKSVVMDFKCPTYDLNRKETLKRCKPIAVA